MMGRERVNYGNFAGDCIHLHACRLLAKRYRDAGRQHVARYCSEECSAYTSDADFIPKSDHGELDTWVTASDAAKMARSLAYMIRSGYDEFDVFCTSDFEHCNTATCGYVIEVEDD